MQDIRNQIRKDKLAYLRTGVKSDLLSRVEKYNG